MNNIFILFTGPEVPEGKVAVRKEKKYSILQINQVNKILGTERHYKKLTSQGH